MTHRPAQALLSLLAVALLGACGTTSVTPAPATASRPTPSPTPNLLASAPGILTRAVSDYNGVLADRGPTLRTEFEQGNYQAMHGLALSLLQSTEGFDSSISPLTNVGAAAADVTALLKADAQFEAVMEQILDATTDTDITGAYPQIAPAQSEQQSLLAKVAADIRMSTAPKLALIAR